MNITKWATPLTIAATIPLCFTGLCLLLHIRGGLIDPIHEISSIFFLVGIAFHTWNHKMVVANHLRQPIGRLLLLFFSLLCFVALVSIFGGDGKDMRAPLEHSNAEQEAK